jgi:hypothetical protein
LSGFTAQQLYAYLQSFPNYTVQQNSQLWSANSWPLTRPNTHTANYADVAGLDIKTAPYVILYDQTKLEPDEMAYSKTTIQNNVAGLTETFYVYPDGIEDPSIEADAAAAGYTAARGSLSMKGQSNTTAPANSLYSNGINIENLTSLAIAAVHGWSQPQIDQLVASLIFRASVWGAPYGFFTHYNSRGDGSPDMSNAELAEVLDAITAHGGTVLSNLSLISAITSGTPGQFSGSTRYIQNPSGLAVNLALATAGSPTVGAGTPTPYPIDLNGMSRAALGAWDIGASTYVSQRYGTASGTGQWKVK